MWQVPTDWKTQKLVRSQTPTLLLSGYFDPITPPENAEHVSAQLTRAYPVTFSTGGHGQQRFWLRAGDHQAISG